MPDRHARPSRSTRLVLAGIATGTACLTGFGLTRHADPLVTATVAEQPVRTQPRSPYDGRSAQSPWAGSPTGQGTSTSASVDAAAAQEIGLVYVTTTLDNGAGTAAGTGMVLTSSGEILTNHHVVEGATSISVQVVSTGRTYDAQVDGYDATHDVAVLHLDDASGLTPVTTDTAEPVQVGDTVTGVGNANGDGGAASAASGTVVALDRSITVSDETTGASSRLDGLIEVDADIISGDSGGPLYDDDGEVVGMDTAASNGTADVTGYAIPIGTALAIADEIESGTASGTVRIGNRGYLGVTLSSTVTGPLVAGVVNGSPAESAGLTAGSTITSLGGTSVTSAEALSTAVADLAVGDRTSVAWVDASGTAHRATVTLGEGPIG